MQLKAKAKVCKYLRACGLCYSPIQCTSHGVAPVDSEGVTQSDSIQAKCDSLKHTKLVYI
jgi:hypothetical protein